MSTKKELNRDEFAIELAKRTKENLENYQGKYEVTALINALLGLFVIPRETFFSDGFNNKKFRDKPTINKLAIFVTDNTQAGEDLGEADLKDIFRHIRNAICHGYVNFSCIKPNAEGDMFSIIGVDFIDDFTNDFGVNTYFKITIPIDELRLVIDEFIEVIVK